jgi:hypothetical protein
MKPISLLLTSLVAGAACLAQGAGAQTIVRSTPVVAMDDGLGGFNAHVGDTFAAAAAGSTFSAVFTFDVGIGFDAAASVTSSYLDNPVTKDLEIVGLSLYRYDPVTMAVLGTAIAGIDIGGAGMNAPDSWTLSGFGLAGGDYALKVDGRVLGAGGGAFGGDLAIAPVPEPGAWGMLLGGLGGLGGVSIARLLARRHRRAPLPQA